MDDVVITSNMECSYQTIREPIAANLFQVSNPSPSNPGKKSKSYILFSEKHLQLIFTFFSFRLERFRNTYPPTEEQSRHLCHWRTSSTSYRSRKHCLLFESQLRWPPTTKQRENAVYDAPPTSCFFY